MIKILYIVTTLENKSPNNVLYNIIKYLDKTKFEVHLVTISPERENTLINKFSALDIKIHCLELSFISTLFGGKRRISKLLSEISPTIIHSQSIRSDYLNSLLKGDFIKISTVHNYLYNDYTLNFGKALGTLMATLNTFFLRKMNICVGVSKAVTNYLIHDLNLEKAVEIQNGIDTEYFYPVSESEKSQKRKELGFPGNSTIWTVSGSIIDRKNPFFTVDAFRINFKNSLTNSLVFIGDGELLEECRNYVKNDTNIFFVGSKKNVIDYLHISDFIVSASKAEGLPMAILEGLACNLKVVLSDIDPHLEILKVDKSLGSTFVLNSEKDLAEKMKEISTNAVNNNRDTVLSHFSINIMGKNYSDLYLKAVNKIK